MYSEARFQMPSKSYIDTNIKAIDPAIYCIIIVDLTLLFEPTFKKRTVECKTKNKINFTAAAIK